MSEEQEMLKLIDERDTAEDALSDMYAIVMGHAPEWSSHFQFKDALKQVEWKLERERSHTAIVNKCGDAIGGFSNNNIGEQD